RGPCASSAKTASRARAWITRPTLPYRRATAPHPARRGRLDLGTRLRGDRREGRAARRRPPRPLAVRRPGAIRAPLGEPAWRRALLEPRPAPSPSALERGRADDRRGPRGL